MGDHYVFQAGIKALSETRTSGQANHGGTMHSGDLYKVGIDTERYEFFTKNAYIFNKEKNTNLALFFPPLYTIRMLRMDANCIMWIKPTSMLR